MKDSELQMLILRRMYDNRKTKRQFFAQDFADLVSQSEFGRICIQLHDLGCVNWEAPAGEDMLAIGFAKLKPKGVQVIEKLDEKATPPPKEPSTETVQALCPNCQGTREALIIGKDQAQEPCYDNPEDPPVT